MSPKWQTIVRVTRNSNRNKTKVKHIRRYLLPCIMCRLFLVFFCFLYLRIHGVRLSMCTYVCICCLSVCLSVCLPFCLSVGLMRSNPDSKNSKRTFSRWTFDLLTLYHSSKNVGSSGILPSRRSTLETAWQRFNVSPYVGRIPWKSGTNPLTDIQKVSN